MKKTSLRPAIPPEVQSRLDTILQQIDAQTQRFQRSLPPTVKRLIRHLHKRPEPSILEMQTALRAGDPEPFFRLLSFLPIILQDEEVFSLTIRKWFARKVLRTPEGKQAQIYLRRLGSVLADTHGATELPEEQRQQNRKESRRKASREFRSRIRSEKERLQKHPESIAAALKDARATTRKAAQQTYKKLK
ncbi:MAG: hypothetical protein ACRERD_17985 [Candidatus Binatia bacterium]